LGTAIEAGKRYTVAGMGYLNMLGTLKIIVFEDDNTPQAGQARGRFIHAVSEKADQGSLDFGLRPHGAFLPKATPPNYSAESNVGGQAYVTMMPQNQATFSYRTTGSSTDLAAFMNKITVNGGSVYTATAIGVAGSFELSLCDDSAAPVAGLLSCQRI